MGKIGSPQDKGGSHGRPPIGRRPGPVRDGMPAGTHHVFENGGNGSADRRGETGSLAGPGPPWSAQARPRLPSPAPGGGAMMPWPGGQVAS